MRRIFRCSLALSFLLLLLAGDSRAQSDMTIYGDGLGPGWADWSWCNRDLASTDAVHSGTHSARLTYTAGFQGFYMRHAGFDDSGYTHLVFWINGGSLGNRAMTVAAHLNDQAQLSVPLASYVEGGFVAANTWRKVTIPLAALGVDNQANFNGFWIQDASGSAQPPFYVDDISLQAAPPPAQILIHVDATNIKRTVDARLFGLNAAVWDDQFNTATTRSLLSANGTRLLRFPGGSLSDEYHWRTNTTLNNTFQWATNFDAFAGVTLALNAQAVITANYGTGTPQEAADWVRYANFTRGYGFKYWEIGNECYGSWETDSRPRPHDPYSYAVAARDYITAMRAADPTIKIGVVVVNGEESYRNYSDHPATNPRTGQTHNGWTPVLLQTLHSFGVTPDFVIYHRYDQNPGGEDDAGLLQSSKSWANDAADLRQQLNDYLGGQAAQVELVCTETNSVSSQPGKQTTSLVNGLFYADNFGQILQTEFVTRMWWDLRNGQETKNNNNPLLYGWRTVGDYGLVSGSNEPYPTYFASKLMALFTAGGDQVVEATSNYNLLAAYSVKRADGALALLLINKSLTNALDANVSLTGFAPPPAATVHSYGKPQDDAAHTGVGPASPDIATTMINDAGANFVFSAPPLSMNVIVMGGAACSVNLSPASQAFTAAGDDDQIHVTLAAECNWTATTGESWIVIHTASGSGSGTVNYTVLENSTGQPRQGQISVSNRAFTVTQEAAPPANCTVAITPEAGKISGSGGTVEIAVSASASACPWQATTNVNWITISAGASGTGNGTVTLTVAPNPEGHKRKGKITVAGNLFVLKQKPGI
jgi:alpha-N-arabinofuranosidase